MASAGTERVVGVGEGVGESAVRLRKSKIGKSTKAAESNDRHRAGWPLGASSSHQNPPPLAFGAEAWLWNALLNGTALSWSNAHTHKPPSARTATTISPITTTTAPSSSSTSTRHRASPHQPHHRHTPGRP
ncbi:hypothetical protein COCVIDRAFT_101866, partial [Bipolaris victoriae FI3]